MLVACPNKECSNYKHELEENPEFCPLCNAKLEEFKAKSNTTFGAIAVIAGFVSFLLLYSPLWYASFVVSPGAVVAAFISKSKFAVVLSILLLAATAGIFIMFVKPF